LFPFTVYMTYKQSEKIAGCCIAALDEVRSSPAWNELLTDGVDCSRIEASPGTRAELCIAGQRQHICSN